MTSLRWVGRLDMYRKIPADLMEGTNSGSLLSYIAFIVMVTLFLLETKAFIYPRIQTELSLDRSDEPKIRLNFNITMMDLKCEYAVVDVVSVLGTEQNVTAFINKWHVDAEGVRQRYQGRNRQQSDIELFDSTVTESLDELYENGIDAISLTPESFQYALHEQEYLFVDFYAGWCSHCRDLAPTWETLAKVMTAAAEHLVDLKDHEYSDEEYEHAKRLELPVMVAKVDCVAHADLCREQMIMAYPTLRLFVDGKRWRGGDYRWHRTILSMVDYLKQIEDTHKTELEKDAPKNVEIAHALAKSRAGGDPLDLEDVSEDEREWAEKVKRRKERLHHSWVDAEHPGCQLSGHLLLDRVPGNFHIQACSPHHDIVPHMTNVSHEIHHLFIGEPAHKHAVETRLTFLPNEIVTTDIPGFKFGRRDMKVHQILQNSQVAFYQTDVVPEAKFIYDLSPVAVTYQKTYRRWYDYITSIMAIIGGTFTVVGMIETSIHAAVVRKRRASAQRIQ